MKGIEEGGNDSDGREKGREEREKEILNVLYFEFWVSRFRV